MGSSLAIVPEYQDNQELELMSAYEQEIIKSLSGIRDQITELTKVTTLQSGQLISVSRETSNLRDTVQDLYAKNQELWQKIHSIELDNATKSTRNTTNIETIQKGIWLIVGATISGIVAAFFTYFKAKGP